MTCLQIRDFAGVSHATTVSQHISAAAPAPSGHTSRGASVDVLLVLLSTLLSALALLLSARVL